MQELEITGKNISEAIETGLKQLGCKKEDVEIKILDEGTSGLFGLMGAKPAKVLLIVKNGENICKIDDKLACKRVGEILTDILKMMNININNIDVAYKDDTVKADISTDNGSLLIGKGGQTLDSVEYIVQLMINNDSKTRVKVSIDTENYRQKQYEKLKSAADKAIEYVKRTKKIYRFDPMNAKERKIIHMYLKTIDGFETFSEGEGSMRKVGVKLSVNK